MIKYSIVIPTYGRNKLLKECLLSVENQTVEPINVFIIDNNDIVENQKSVKQIIENFSSKKINFSYHKGLINSGAVARNHGASLVSTELVAFLDDDVILDVDYYEKVINVFNDDDQVVGVQGIDKDFIESYKTNIRNKFMGKLWLGIENFFEHASIIKGTDAPLRPSLAVCHPNPDVDFFVESEWISTCAGVFKTDLFQSIEFPKEFVKYSWNEYVFFSYSIYKKKLGTMIYTSSAKYRNVPTDAGRVPLKDLVYMAEVYDLYVFSELFNRNLLDKIIYVKSRLGRFLFYFARSIKRKEFDLALPLSVLGAFYFSFMNREEIKKGNFDCYNKRFPLN